MIPIGAGHRCVEYGAGHSHARDGAHALLDFAEEWEQFLLLIVGKQRIDRDQIPAAGIESEVLVLQIAQALP